MSRSSYFRIVHLFLVLLLVMETNLPAAQAAAPRDAPKDADAPMRLFAPLVQKVEAPPPPSAACELYPIILYAATLAGVSPGDMVADVRNGVQPGSFGWLSWDGDTSLVSLITSLTPPGNGGAYINPNDAADHTLARDEWVRARPGVAGTVRVQAALDRLSQIDIAVPVWDSATGSGGTARYHVVRFANIRLLGYRLAADNYISIRFLGYNAACGDDHDPVAVDDAYSTNEDTALSVAAPGVLANDTDADGNPLSATLVDQPANGAVALNADGAFVYTPAADAAGLDSFTYRIVSGNRTSTVATVQITVHPVNDLPLAGNDSATTDEDAPVTIDVLGNDSDVDGGPLTITMGTAAQNGVAAADPAGAVTYTPNADFCGQDGFTYWVADSQGSRSQAAVAVTVACLPDAPRATDDTTTTDEDVPVSIAVLANDYDADGDAMTVTAVTSPAHGTADIETGQSVLYAPAPRFRGADTFTYTVCDTGGLCAVGNVTVGVSGVGHPPTVVDDDVQTDEDTPITLDVTANDSDVDGNLEPASATIQISPTHGSVTSQGDGRFTYRPAPNYHGQDSLTYRVCDDGEPDGIVYCGSAAVSITVRAVNDSPVAVDDTLDAVEDTLLTTSAPGILANDTDVDGDPLKIAGYDQPAEGTLVQNSDGSLRYEPFANVCDGDSYRYTVSDGNGGWNEGTVTIRIACVNDAPVAVDDSYLVLAGETLIKAAPGVLANDTDVEGSPLRASAVSQPDHGELSFAVDGSFIYTPALNYNGPDGFTYQVGDGTANSNVVTVAITVKPRPAEASGRGVIGGEVYDDATGLPIAGATAELLSLDAVELIPPATALSDAHGRFRFVSDPGVARFRVGKAGYTTGERTVAVVGGRIVLPFDTRLTPVGDNRTLLTSLLGGTVSDAAGHATVTVPPFALADDQQMALVWISGQGLAGRLPVGWSPLAVVDLFPHHLTFAEAAALAIPLLSPLPNDTAVVAARWEESAGQWVALGNAGRSGDGAALQFDLAQTGQVALLLADAMEAPPAAIVGQPIAAAPVLSPSATLTAAIDPSPRVLFAAPDARSQVGVRVSADQPLQSGAAVQVGLDDRYDFFSGSLLAPDGLMQDFTLYAYPAGQLSLRADFAVSPARPFDAYALRLGSIDLEARRPLALATPVGTVLTAGGGRVMAANGVAVNIPANASAGDLPVLLSPLTLDEIPLDLPDALAFLDGLALDFHGAALNLPVTLAAAVPPGYAAGDQVLVVQWVEAHGASHLELVAVAVLQGDELVATTDPLGDGTLALPGIRGEGRYLFLRAQLPLGYIAGLATDGNSQPLAAALVTPDTLPIVALSDAAGHYVLAAPVGAVNVTAVDPNTQDTSVQGGQITAKNAVLALGIALVPAAPVVLASDPAPGAADISILSSVRITFSKVIDRASVAPDVLTLAQATGAVSGSVALLPGDRILTFQPHAPLRSDTAYTATAATAIQDLYGRGLAAPFVAHFSTEDTTPPLPPAAGMLAATIPDAEGYSTVTGSQGTVEPEWIVSIRNLSTQALTSVLPESNGSFSVRVPALTSDRLEFVLYDSAGNATRVAVPAFRNADGSTVVGADGGVVEGAGGVAVTADPGALPDGTVVKVEPITRTSDLPIPLPPISATLLNFIGGLQLDLGGVVPNQSLDISIPAPANATITDTVLVMRSVELTQSITLPDGTQTNRFWTLVDRAHLDPATWSYKTASPPFPGVSIGSSYAYLSPVYMISPGLDRILQSEVQIGSNDVLTQSFDANGLIDVIRPGADGELQSRLKVGSDDELQQECMSYVTVPYSVGYYVYPFASVAGAFFLHPLLLAGDVTVAASCNQPIRIQAFAPDTGSILAEITEVAPPTRNQILYPQNRLTNDHDAPYVVFSALPTGFGSAPQEVQVAFSEKMDPESVEQYFMVLDSRGSLVGGRKELLFQNRSVIFRPHVAFRLGESYSVVFSNTTDFAGNPVQQGLLTFTRAAPGSLGELRDVAEIAQALTKCSPGGACYSAARDVAAVGNTVFFANGTATLGDQYPDPANPKRLLVVDTTDPASPRLIGWHRASTDPRAVAVLRDISFSYTTPASAGGQRVQFEGDLLVVIGGGRPSADFAASARLEVYNVTPCFAALAQPNCLDEQTFHPLVGEKYLSTGLGLPQRIGVPTEPGVAAELDVLHRRQLFSTSGEIRREDTAVAYAVVVPIGLEAVNIVDAFRTYAQQSTAADRYAIDGLYRGDFFDVAMVKNEVAAAEMPSGAAPRLRVFNKNLLPADGVPVPRAFRLTTGENFVFDVDRDGNLGQGEDDDGDPLTGRGELYDLAVIASGGRSSLWGQGELYVVDVSHLTDLAHPEPEQVNNLDPLDPRVLSRIFLPGAASELCVDSLAQLAYVNLVGQGLAVVDLSHILSVIRDELSAGAVIDDNSDSRDDRILYIFQSGADPVQGVRGIDCKDMPWELATGADLDPTHRRSYQTTQPGMVFLNWERTGGEVLGNFSLSARSPIVLETEADVINRTTCAEGGAIEFVLSHPATVTVRIDGVVMQADGDLLEAVNDGVDDGLQPVQDVYLPAGHHALPIPPDMVLQTGEYSFDIHAVFLAGNPGVTRTVDGLIEHRLIMRSALPLGHMMVGGVDLWDGHLTHSSQDLLIPGRKLALEFDRAYSSAGADSSGPLGAGWSHNLDVRLIRDRCGRLVVVGGAGTGNTFTNPHTDPAKAALFNSSLFTATAQALFYTPQMGYHSTLVQDPQRLDRFDFFTKGHVRYHFRRESAFSGEVYTLRFIEEPNGNRLTFDYTSVDQDTRTLDTVTDAAGRVLSFEYAEVAREQRIVRLSAQVVSPSDVLHADLNIRIDYGYDALGNLTVVTRTTPYAGFQLNDERVERYAYSTELPADPHNLRTYTDPNGNLTEYVYYAETDVIPGYSAGFQVAKHEFVKEIRQPEGTITAYEYTISTDVNVPNVRSVDDPRPQVGPTVYTLNNYGAAVQIDAPLGRTTSMIWCTGEPLDPACEGKLDVLIAGETDALGRTFRYRYDDLGNLLEKTVSFGAVTDSSLRPVLDAGGSPVTGVTTRYTYDPLFSLMTSETDAEAHTTWYCLDSPAPPPAGSPCQATGGKTGNLLALIDAAGNVTSYTYTDNGDRFTGTDAESRVTHYTYDQFGNGREVVDPLDHVMTTEHDARSRPVKVTDSFGHHVEYRYDGLDRPIAEIKINHQPESGPNQGQVYRYLPGGQMISLTSGLSQLPPVGLPLAQLLAQGHTTEYFYDGMNRQVKMVEHAVLQPDAAGTRIDLTGYFTHDVVGNLVQELNSRGVLQSHTYDALNRRIGTTVSGPFGAGSVTTFAATYDVADNLRTETNLHGATTTYLYDALYQVVETQLPFQHDFADVPFQTAKLVATYDLVGHQLSETDANGHTTTYVYDEIYRLRTKTDADGNAVAYTYDNVGNTVDEENLSSGLLLEYGYDVLDRITAMTQTVPLAGPALTTATYVTTYRYEDADNAVVVTNPRGVKTRTDRDSLDRVYRTVQDLDALGLITTVTYDAFGNAITVTDPQDGDVDVTYDYDGLGRKLRATYVDTPSDQGQPVVETFAYDGNDNLIRYGDKRQTEFSYTYDNLDRKLAEIVVERISNQSQPLTLASYAYLDDVNAQGLYAVEQTDANQNVTTVQYDRLDRLTVLTDPLNNVLRVAYDGVNKRVETGKRGQITHFTYDAVNRLVLAEEFDLDGVTLRTTTATGYRDAQSQVVATDRRGVVTIRQNDGLGRLVQLSRSGLDMATHYQQDEVVLERYLYDGNGNLTAFEDAQGNRTTYTYDALDRTLTTTAGAGSLVEATTTWTYDNAGNVLTVKDGRDHAGATGCPHAAVYDDCYAYDARYRLVSATNGAGATTTYSYDGNDNRVAMTEPLGAAYTTVYRYDELDQLLAVDETPRSLSAAAGVTRFLYDANRNRIAQQDAAGHLVTYLYDALNRLTDTYQHTVAGALTDDTPRGAAPGGDAATGLHWHYDYDANGNQTLIVDAEGQRVEKRYDYLERLEHSSYTNHTDPALDFQVQSIAYTYDGNGNTLAATETKILSGSVVVESTAYTYDPLDRVQSVTRRAYDDAAGKTIAYDYDRQGNRTTIVDPDAITTIYTYDARNRLDTVTTAAGDTQYSWWEDDLLKQVVYPNYTIHDRSDGAAYDSADRIRQIENRRTGPVVAAYSTYAYTYDANGNRLTQVETQQALGSGQAQTTTYTYDGLNRLATVDYGDAGGLLYTYDAVGNRLTEQGTDPRTGNALNRSFEYGALADYPRVTFDGVNALTRIVDHLVTTQTITYEYDANLNQVGRVRNGTRTAYRYNIRDQMVAADMAGAQLRFDYNADSLRVKKIGSGEETRYLYDDAAVLVETDAAGQTVHKYDYGYALLALTTVNGATRAGQFYLTDALLSTANLADENGDLIQSYRYDAWGSVLDAAGSSANPRQYTGQYHDDETGLDYFGARYYDSEIGRFLNQDPYLGEANTPPSLHRYLYAYANPLRYVDPTGYAVEMANPEEFNSSALETETLSDKNFTALQRGGYSVMTARGATAAALVNWLNGEHPTKVEETKEEMTGAPAGDAARRFQRYVKERKAELEQEVQDNPGVVSVVRATVKASAWDLLASASNVLKLGEGAAKGGWGWAEDAFRLLDIVDVVTGVSGLARHGAKALFAAGARRTATRLASGVDDLAVVGLRYADNLAADMLRHADDLAERAVGRAGIDDIAGMSCAINSFTPDTLVITADGSVPIAEVAEGDQVLSSDELTGDTGYQPVTALIQGERVYDLVVITMATGTQIVATDQHAFYVAGAGWRPAAALAAGDELLNRSGARTAIASVTRVRLLTQVYNLTVADTHTYYVSADELLVHNAKRCWKTSEIDVSFAEDRIIQAFEGRVVKTASGEASFVIDELERTRMMRLHIEGSHPHRAKEKLPELAERLRGDHRGHLGPEGGARFASDVRRREALIAEVAASNQGPKKQFDNLAVWYADTYRGSYVETYHIPLYAGTGRRPYAVVHYIMQDDEIVFGIKIANPGPK